MESVLALHLKNAPKPVMKLRDIVAQCLVTDEGIKAQETYLNGVSPEGNALLDRAEVAKIVRKIAQAKGLTIPAMVKTISIAKVVLDVQRDRLGLKVDRRGRIDMLALENEAKASDPGEGATAD
jgi:hypothetical protein